MFIVNWKRSPSAESNFNPVFPRFVLIGIRFVSVFQFKSIKFSRFFNESHKTFDADAKEIWQSIHHIFSTDVI